MRGRSSTRAWQDQPAREGWARHALVVLYGLRIWLGHLGHSFRCLAERLGSDVRQFDSCEVAGQRGPVTCPSSERRGGEGARVRVPGLAGAMRGVGGDG